MPAGASTPWEAAGRRLAGGCGARRGWGRCAYAPRAGANREPGGTQRTAPGACILSDTGYIQVSLAKAEGFEQALEIGALQPQGLGGRRMIALSLGQRLAQQRALEGHRGVMI
jgi:hypothetical protein